MNSVSWFLYLADVVQGLNVYLGFFLAIVTFAMIIFSGISIGAWVEEEKNWPYKLNYLWVLVFFIAGISIAIPSKDTVYAISVSELGEDIYKSEIGQKATKALESWIDSQLKEKKNNE